MKYFTPINLLIGICCFLGGGIMSQTSNVSAPHNVVLCSTRQPESEIQTQSTLGEQSTDFFSGILDTSLWPARWHCGNWSAFHGWLYIISDGLIGVSYFLIPLILFYFLYRQKSQKPAFRLVVLLFISFILACGLTHFADAALFWWPAYRLSAVIRFVTAGISISTVFALIRVGPSLIQLKSVASLEKIIEERTKELHRSLKLVSDYKKALDESSIVAITDQRGVIQHVNENFCRVSGYSNSELIGKDHRTINSGYHSLEFFQNIWSTISAGRIWKGELKNKAKNGSVYWEDTTIVPFLNEQGRPYQYVAVKSDITERKKIHEEQLRLAEIVHNSFNEVYIFDAVTFRFQFANSSALLNMGYTLDELRSITPESTIERKSYNSIQKVMKQLEEGAAEFVEIQAQHIRKDGTVYDIEAIIQHSHDGNSFVVIGTDITSKLTTEKKLRAALDEKEILIKEIHHRVKNNLQLISSILYIKMKGIADSETRTFLDETQRTIRSIALIHERLLQTQSVDKVDSSDYLGKLIIDLQMSISRKELDIEIEKDIAHEEMKLDTAIYCGLIINELITNSIKHAFHDRMKGTIQVTIGQDQDHHQLIVSDDGMSLNESISPGKTESFGMQLLDIFIKQLKGQFKIDRTQGTSFIITFP